LSERQKAVQSLPVSEETKKTAKKEKSFFAIAIEAPIHQSSFFFGLPSRCNLPIFLPT
jgi:hypothetical protein